MARLAGVSSLAMKRRRPYLLLELLISISLLALCAIPLLSAYPRQIGSNISSIRHVQKERLARLLFTEVVEMLERQKIPWSQVPPLKEVGKKVSLGERQLSLPKGEPLRVKTSYSFATLREKAETGGKIHRLVAVRVLVDDAEFRFRVILSRHLA